MFLPLEQPDKCASQTNVLHASACEAAMLRAPVSGVLTDDVITECESPPPHLPVAGSTKLRASLDGDVRELGQGDSERPPKDPLKLCHQHCPMLQNLFGDLRHVSFESRR